jgi:hypothetical protein
MVRVAWRKCLSSSETCGLVRGDMELVDVRILVLWGLMAIPSGALRVGNSFLKSQEMSRWAMIVLVSSMKEFVWDSEPKLSLPGHVWWSERRDLERVWSCLLMCESRM